ncbi:hypothetical protein DSO57_1013121 [Entomophthora muscae]|uniref:Uncharacterized protein n=1 Tax=Entomophthora muscae TaxID=34485 RepID=A0ACC2U3U8_9FUNG|nr:hypothetical protein DSO57_1013121 [Entomophthora muscae]
MGMLMACGALEIVDTLNIFQVAQGSTLIAIVRIVSSLRTLSMLHRSAIDKEVYFNRSLEATICELMNKIDARQDENKQIEDDIFFRRGSITKAKEQLDSINENMMAIQSKSWRNLVPSSFNVDLANKRSKSRKNRTGPTPIKEDLTDSK